MKFLRTIPAEDAWTRKVQLMVARATGGVRCIEDEPYSALVHWLTRNRSYRVGARILEAVFDIEYEHAYLDACSRGMPVDRTSLTNMKVSLDANGYRELFPETDDD